MHITSNILSHSDFVAECMVYSTAKPWQHDEMRSIALSLSGQPAGMPSEADEWDADLWIAAFVENDKAGAPLAEEKPRRNIKQEILSLIESNPNQTTAQLAQALGEVPQRIHSHLATLESNRKIYRSGSKPIQWAISDAPEFKSLDEFLLSRRADSGAGAIAEVLRAGKSMTAGVIAEKSGQRYKVVSATLQKMHRVGVVERARSHYMAGAYEYRLAGVERENRSGATFQLQNQEDGE